MVNGGSAVVQTFNSLQAFPPPSEIELLVYLDEPVLGVDEVSRPLAGELERSRVSSVTIECVEHLGFSLIFDARAIVLLVRTTYNDGFSTVWCRRP